MITKAIQIAIKAHANQHDKAGAPYILHLIRVMQKGKTDEEKICGILHDLVEDTNWSFQQLEKEGFSNEIIEALKCVTKKENENYENFINRISKNKLATKVKLYDLEDNLDIKRLKNIDKKSLERINKYLHAFHRLKMLH
ncbi:HD domain-containing protein [Ornithobacterium rhinotracheale]|uniref:HD domain-containing protein n=1 Tax=Ornithobacterium rhinotracheale TaxID=28251 RepID=UPI00129C3DD7|nr:HD domain-containing protein [Ornithobacterium rhinotracheale]MRJ11297.1 HD domain-containing protein [Ornithobacterium rhinotracheale]